MTDHRGMMEGLGGPVRMDKYATDGIDPTLDACCEREVLSNRQKNAMERTLRRHDVVAMAERRRRNIVTTSAFEGCRCCYDPNSDGGEYRALVELRNSMTCGEISSNSIDNRAPTAAGEHGNYRTESKKHDTLSDHHSDGRVDSDSDDEFDYLLDEDLPNDEGLKAIEDMRRAELEMQMLAREVALQHGYGTHRQLHPGRVLKAAGLGDRTVREPPPAVVLHLVDPDSIASASLDLYLEQVAASDEAKGTIFLRSGGRSTFLMDAELSRKAFPRLKADKDIPALIAIRDGMVVNLAPSLRGLTNNGIIDKRSVFEWLDKSGVIIARAPQLDYLCHIRPEEEALMDYLATIKPNEEEERYDCGLPECFKAYPHEHVGIQTSEQNGLVVSEETILDNSSNGVGGV